jgi:hypothetical protein
MQRLWVGGGGQHPMASSKKRFAKVNPQTTKRLNPALQYILEVNAGRLKLLLNFHYILTVDFIKPLAYPSGEKGGILRVQLISTCLHGVYGGGGRGVSTLWLPSSKKRLEWKEVPWRGHAQDR